MSAKIYKFGSNEAKRAFELANKFGEAADDYEIVEIYTALSMMLARLDMMAPRSNIDGMLRVMDTAVRQYREQLLRSGARQGEPP